MCILFLNVAVFNIKALKLQEDKISPILFHGLGRGMPKGEKNVTLFNSYSFLFSVSFRI